MTETKLSMNATEIKNFVDLAGITLRRRGTIFPRLCARSTIVYSAVGKKECSEMPGEYYIPMYEEEYENQTGFSQSELNMLERGFEGCRNMEFFSGKELEAYNVGKELARMAGY